MLAAIFGDGLDPGRVDLAGVMARMALGALPAPNCGANFGIDEVAGIARHSSVDVALERAAGVVGRKPRAHLLVGQPLQLSSLATHPSALRRSLLTRVRRRSCRDNG